MKTNKLAGSICALLLTALGASTAAAQTSTASILVTRAIYRFDGAHGSQLYRVQPSGQNLTTLVPVTYGVDIYNPSWSPGGSSVVFEAAAHLYVVNRQGGSPRQLTTGDGLQEYPSWGPKGVIAFVTRKVHGECLATVRGDGTDQHIVFCPVGVPGESWSIGVKVLRWTASGNGVLLTAEANEGGLEPEKWYSEIYRVNVSTGAAVKLTSQVFDGGERDLAISPDGVHGVYSGGPMQAIDLTTNTLTPLPTDGLHQVYSPDGAKIAFLRYETDIKTWRIYIMRADGTSVHRAPAQTTNPDVYNNSISDWSADGTRLLFNQVGSNQWVRMIDLRNKTARNVTNGVADEGAWFHP